MGIRLDTRLPRVLVEDGALSADALEDALQVQHTYGGTLDTILLETTDIDERRLAQALSDAWATSMVDVVRSERPDPKALEKVPRSLALALGLCPFAIEKDTLHFMSAAPQNEALLEDLAPLLGMRCEGHVVPEVRLAQGFANAYGKNPSARLRTLLARIEIKRTGKKPSFDVDDTTPALGSQALERDVDDPAEWDLVEALAHLVAQDSRSGIADVVLAYARRFLPFAAVIGVRENALWGWKRSGAHNSEQFEHHALPLAESQTLAQVVQSPSPFLGQPPESDIEFFGWLGRRRPWSVLVIPIVVADRTVAVLFGDGGVRSCDFNQLSDLVAFGARIGPAFEALLRARHRASEARNEKAIANKGSAPTYDERLRQLKLALPPLVLDDMRAPKVTVWSEVPEDFAEDDFEEGVDDEVDTLVIERKAVLESLSQDSKDSLDQAIDVGFLEWNSPGPDALRHDDDLLDDSADNDIFPNLNTTLERAMDTAVQGANDVLFESPPIARGETPALLVEEDWEDVALVEHAKRASQSKGQGERIEMVVAKPEECEAAPKPLLNTLQDASTTNTPEVSTQQTHAAQKSETLDVDVSAQSEEKAVAKGQLTHSTKSDQNVPGDKSDVAFKTRPVEKSPERSPSHWVPRLLHNDSKITREAVEALIDLGPSSIAAVARVFPGNVPVDPFGAGTEPTEPEQLGAVVEVLARLGPVSLQVAAKEIDSPNRLRRYVATFIFSLFKDTRTLKMLRPRLHDSEPAIQRLAAEALKQFLAEPAFDVEILAPLRARLRSPKFEIRARGVWLLGYFRDPRSVEVLIQQLGESNNPLKFEVGSALRKITLQDFPSKERPWKKWWQKARYRSRIDWMIDALRGKDVELRTRAAIELSQLTGDSFGYDPKGKRGVREKAAQRYENWWQTQQGR